MSGLDIREIARPVMKELVAEVGETVVLLVPGPDVAVCIDHVEGTSPIRPRSLRVGEHVAYNGGAAPLAIFAFVPERDQERIIETGLRRLTENTVVNPGVLRERCAEIVLTKFCYSRSEAILGTAAVAAPIFFGVPASVVGAISLTGLQERVVGVEYRVLAAAEEICNRLGASRSEGDLGEPQSNHSARASARPIKMACREPSQLRHNDQIRHWPAGNQ